MNKPDKEELLNWAESIVDQAAEFADRLDPKRTNKDIYSRYVDAIMQKAVDLRGMIKGNS